MTLGTGQRAALDDRPVAGKTGTTENYGDAWFVGYTPSLAVAVWVGYPDRLQPMLHEFDGGPVAGGTYPALIFKTFAKSAVKLLHQEPQSFDAPTYPSAASYLVTYRDGGWLRDNGLCRDTHSLVFFSGSAPDAVADCKPNEVSVPNVVGAKLLDAQTRLAAQPLESDVIFQPAQPGIDRPGIVLKQEPIGGTLGSFETVRLFVAKATDDVRVVPRLLELPLGNALQRLERRGLQAQVAELGEGQPGIVLKQLPEAGLAAEAGAVVTLYVGPQAVG